MKALFLLLVALVSPSGLGAQGTPQVPPMPEMPHIAPIGPVPPPSQDRGPGISLEVFPGDSGRKKLSTTLEIVLLMTVLTLAPAIVLTMTSFTRIIIVLSFMKRAMSVQEMPPSLVVSGFALFLTIFIMKPVLSKLHERALEPYMEEKIDILEAGNVASGIMGDFLMKQTREADLALMYSIAKETPPKTPDDVPFHLLVPSFILSEVKTAFQMGFILFLPFLVIDMVIASVLISMGMFTLPPIVISTPFKVLLFILVDGWNIVINSAITSFYA